MGPIRTADRVIAALERAAMLLSGLMLLAILLVSTVDVAMRYLLNSPLPWSYDLISLYLMAGLFFFAVSDTLRANEHVSVDLLHSRMSPRQRHIALFLGLAPSLFVVLLMTDAAWERLVDSLKNHEVIAGAIEWPVWISALFVALGFTLLSARLTLRVIGHATCALTGREILRLPAISGAQEAV